MCQTAFVEMDVEPLFTLAVLVSLAALVQACGGLTEGGAPPPALDSGFPGDSGPLFDGGTPCNNDQDCVGGSCVWLDSCPGTCLAYRTQGQSCGSDFSGVGTCSVNGVVVPCQPLSGECVPDSGLDCDPIAHVCGPIPPVVIADAGEPCSIFGATCNVGLFCAGVFPDNGTCEPFVQDGGTCYIDNPGCVDGLTCVGIGTALDAGVCEPFAPVGGSCLTMPEGGPPGGSGESGCEPFLQCVQGQCVQPPASGACLNGACQEDASFCDDAGTCQPLWANGTACSPPGVNTAQCASRFCDLTGHCGTTPCPGE